MFTQATGGRKTQQPALTSVAKSRTPANGARLAHPPLTIHFACESFILFSSRA